jgi:hypothetical protein
MAKMTPEQEAVYALGFGVVSSDLPPEAQLAYDRLVEQQARAAASAPVPRRTPGPPSRRLRWDQLRPTSRRGLALPVGPGQRVLHVALFHALTARLSMTRREAALTVIVVATTRSAPTSVKALQTSACAPSVP